MMNGSEDSIAPGSLVQLRHIGRYVPGIGYSKVKDPGVVIKSLGIDPNSHECFQVLFRDKIMTAWDDELEKLADSP